MICIVALIVFGILGIFSAKYRIIAKEASECVFRRLTLRKCETGLDKRLKNQISGNFAKRSPKLGKFLFKYFEVFSWLFLALLIWSIIIAGIGLTNFVKYGNCYGPENNGGFCIFDPTGSQSQYSGIKMDYPEKIIYPTAGNDPSIGPENYEVLIIQFGCFSCPYTKSAEPVMLKLIDEYSDKPVKFVFKEFPLPKHPGAMETAIAAECAYQKGKYFEAREYIFLNQDKITTGDLYRNLAKEIGEDETEFINCMNNPSIKETVMKNFKEGINAHIYGTPTVFINNKTIVGPKEINTYKKIIDEELSRNK